MSKLSKGERMVFMAGVALLVCSFIPLWAKVEASAFGVDFSERGHAWNSYGFFPVGLGVLLAVIALGLVVARMAGASLKVPPQTLAGLGAGATVLLILGILMGPEGQDIAIAGAGIEVSRGPLLFVSPLLAAAMAYGGYQVMSESPAAAAPAAPTPPAL